MLGDWEGSGIHGIPLSFVLARRHGRVVVEDLVIGLPEACARPSTQWLAQPFPRTSYLGPGSPGIGLISRRPNEVTLYAWLATSPFPLSIDGAALSRRRLVVSMPLSGTAVTTCRWPRRLTWHMHAAHRVTVADGTWSGQLAAPGAASAPITFTVTDHGRLVDAFGLTVTCTGGGGGSFSAGPGAGEFIRADGSFTGLGDAWSGTFGADGVLRGTSFDPGACTGSSSVTGPFTATLISP